MMGKLEEIQIVLLTVHILIVEVMVVETAEVGILVVEVGNFLKWVVYGWLKSYIKLII